MFEIKNLSKQYGTEFVLNDITMDIDSGMNFIIGASGSGKTTLLKLLSGIEQDFEGSITYCGKDICNFSDAEKSILYNSEFGFIWQDFHLLEEATILENILLPTYLKDKQAENIAKRILKQVKLEDMKNKKVKYLSGGQKQRVAIVRELMKNPKVIFCDEPTSALDSESAKIIMDILRNLSKSKTVIVVTHDTSFGEKKDTVFELDKGELISATNEKNGSKAVWKVIKEPYLSLKKAFQIAKINLKNKLGRTSISVVSLLIAGILLLTTVSGAIGTSSQGEFDKLVETYGEGILDIGLVSSFMSASGAEGTEEDEPNGNVNQDLNGLYEKYQDDKRVEFIISMQPFENIQVTFDGTTYAIEKTGNSPVLTKLLSGDVPKSNEKEFQVVIPIKFAESIGLTKESALGKKIDFSATIFQWIDDQPVEKPIQIQATICGVADNTVVYDYEGQTYDFSVDDSFFFNKEAIEEVRKQAEIEDGSANFTIRAKTPEDLISLKDELNKSGIVPLGRFELVEDIVRLNQQTVEQSSSVSIVISILSVLLVVIIFTMTSILRKREYAIYKVSGFHNGQLLKILFAETVVTSVGAILLMLVTSPVLNIATKAVFNVSILSANKLAIGTVLIVGVSVLSFIAGIPSVLMTSFSSMVKAGDKA